MRLTIHTDHALRMLMLLAIEPGPLHTIDDIARRYNISRSHLMKIAQTLVRAGFIESARGRHGGLRLGCVAKSINLGAVVRATEDSFTLVECFNQQRNACVITPVCGLRGPLEEALHAFLGVLDRYSLDDLVKSAWTSRRMSRLLGKANTE
jgi:Rrf2 family transcriptional regulator, nitric oxide-sensitive transcriptional repressor